ncbi:MAG: hypothetical protein FJ096_04295 [Deltaproteobacteria bacterium]|nr:hypothetical protein [Deltaproteobacteria bacterium]
MTRSTPSMNPRTALALAALATSTLSGCTYHYRWSPPTAMGSRSVGSEEHREPAPHVSLGNARLEGTRLSIETTRTCQWLSRESIETTYAYHEQPVRGEPTSQDRVARPSVAGAVAGGATLLTGIALLPVGLSMVGEPSGSPQPVLVGGAIAAGAGALALGLSFLPALTLPDKRVADITVRETPTGRTCEAEPAADVPVVGVAGARALLLGTSDARGRVEIDLAKLLEPRELLDAGVRIKLSLRLAREHGGAAVDVDQVAIYRALEPTLWGAVAKEPCATSRTHEACADVLNFLALYPDGTSSPEARRLVGSILENLQGGS